MVPGATRARIARLPCWAGPVDVAPLPGGMTNRNYRVTCAGDAFVVRLGQDLPVHGVMRFNELAAARAAHTVGLSAEVVYASRGVMVSRFIEGRTLVAADLRDPQQRPEIVALLRRCHHDIPHALRSPVLTFNVFQVIRNYLLLLRQTPGALLRDQLPRLQSIANTLERDIPPMPSVFGHNDLLAGNFLHDGHRLWLIDWDYAGFSHPLFDLANLSANNAFTPELDTELLTLYFGQSPDAKLFRAFKAMQCASILRELLWAAVSHSSSKIRFDFAAYTQTWQQRMEESYRAAGYFPITQNTRSG